MPSSATSSPLADATTGRSINVATCPNRGETNASRGPDVLTSALLQRRTQPGDVVRVEPFDSERDHGPAVDGHRRAVDRDPCSSSEALERLAGERLLVLG